MPTNNSKTRYFPHLAGSLVIASAGVMAFLGKWEPAHSNPGLVYADKLAGGLPTVCKGITRHVTSTPVIVGEVWSEEKCAREEAAAVERVQLQLAKCFKVLPPQGVFDMATSHAWNLGAGATCGSGAMAAWNRGDWALGCRRISRGDDGTLVWAFVSRVDAATGKKTFVLVRGLANRRADETDDCLQSIEQPGVVKPAVLVTPGSVMPGMPRRMLIVWSQTMEVA